MGYSAATGVAHDTGHLATTGTPRASQDGRCADRIVWSSRDGADPCGVPDGRRSPSRRNGKQCS